MPSYTVPLQKKIKVSHLNNDYFERFEFTMEWNHPEYNYMDIVNQIRRSKRCRGAAPKRGDKTVIKERDRNREAAIQHSQKQPCFS